MTWIYEFRPGNKTIYVVFDEESEFSGPRTPKLRPDQVFDENVPYKKIENVIFKYVLFLLISFVLICSPGYKKTIRRFFVDAVELCLKQLSETKGKENNRTNNLQKLTKPR